MRLDRRALGSGSLSRRAVVTATPHLLLAASLLALGPPPATLLQGRPGAWFTPARAQAAVVTPASSALASSAAALKPASSAELASSAAALLQLIPAQPFGAPATNETLPSAIVSQIEAEVLRLEAGFGGRNAVRDPYLNGSWRLLYSDGREIASLAAGFPGGFQLGPTYQPIDVATGRFENQGSVVNRFGVARLSTCVVGDV